VSAATAQNAASTDENVVAVRIVTEDGRVLSEAPEGLAVAIGKRLNREQVAESIRALYRTGDYRDLRAISTPVEGGVRVDFVAREQLFFQSSGHSWLGVSAIGGFGDCGGAAFAGGALPSGCGERRDWSGCGSCCGKRDSMRPQSWRKRCRISPTTRMDVIINIQPGSRARASRRLNSKNGTEYRDAEILSRSKLKAGRGLYRGARASAALRAGAQLPGEKRDT